MLPKHVARVDVGCMIEAQQPSLAPFLAPIVRDSARVSAAILFVPVAAGERVASSELAVPESAVPEPAPSQSALALEPAPSQYALALAPVPGTFALDSHMSGTESWGLALSFEVPCHDPCMAFHTHPCVLGHTESDSCKKTHMDPYDIHFVTLLLCQDALEGTCLVVHPVYSDVQEAERNPYLELQGLALARAVSC